MKGAGSKGSLAGDSGDFGFRGCVAKGVGLFGQTQSCIFILYHELVVFVLLYT